MHNFICRWIHYSATNNDAEEPEAQSPCPADIVSVSALRGEVYNQAASQPSFSVPTASPTVSTQRMTVGIDRTMDASEYCILMPQSKRPTAT